MNPWEDLAFELPNGQLVCSRHRLDYCAICTVDFRDEEEYDEDEDSEQDEEETKHRLLNGERVCREHKLRVCRQCDVDTSYEKFLSEEDKLTVLPNGQVVCREHFLTVCSKCNIDYGYDIYLYDSSSDSEDQSNDAGSFSDQEFRTDIANTGLDRNKPLSMQHDKIDSTTFATLTSDEIDEMMGLPKKKRGTGLVIPTKFSPPDQTSTPTDLFPGTTIRKQFARYIHREDPTKRLIFTDGACINNGQANPRAGWGIVVGPSNLGAYSTGNRSGRLEEEGPFGDEGAQTSNRAELRAVLAALGLRAWDGEGCLTLVFATDSAYVTEGATLWTKKWLKNGWKTSSGAPVKNKDLWEMLLGEVERFADVGMKVQFWRISRELNSAADALAKEGALSDTLEKYTLNIGF